MEHEIAHKFNDLCRLFIKKKTDELKPLNKTEKKIYISKHMFLNRKSKLPFYKELLKYTEITEKFSEEEIKQITIHLINKIRGIYKHAQAEKTMLCNIDIISSIKLNRFCICVTKNTIEANSQWTKRLIKDLTKEFPGRPLKKLILICSSGKPNTLNGNARHCKNVNEVIANLTKCNTFRVLFICSNTTRIGDILEILESYRGLNSDKQLPINIQYDEAHNLEEGIPSKREIIENILMNPFIERFVPCSASENPIHDDTNPLWQKENLDNNAFDYTHISAIKSTSPDYSSLHDAIPINFEEIETHPSYTEYNVTEFKLIDFKKVDDHNYSVFKKQQQQIYDAEGYSEEDIDIILKSLIKDDINRRRQLEFCHFLQGERKGYNMGLNILDNYFDVPGTQNKIFIPNIKNIYIIQTPNRVAFTYSLMKHAIERDYKPILIGLYRGKINLMYKDINNITQEIDYAKYSENGSDKELNEKIYETLNYLCTLNININAPIIIMGNYKPTGESITFVNYTYGPLRSVILIPKLASTPESDYQTLCRGNYTLTKFKEHDTAFVAPEKIICSYKQNIVNALIIEKRNDDRIDELKERNETDNSVAFIPILKTSETEGVSENGTENVSIPVKIQIIDPEDDDVLKLFEIFKKDRRSQEDMKQILSLISKGISTSAITFVDKTNKFNFERYNLKVVRTYRKNSETEMQERKDKMGENYKPFENDWRFRQYEANHNQNMPYLNYPKIEQYECQLYGCNDRYIYEEYINPKHRIWLSYRF
jgi:hypothetical protein